MHYITLHAIASYIDNKEIIIHFARIGAAPVATDALHEPASMLSRAMCAPTNEDEQAVSMLTDGPLMANV